jgi:hypothetical protein
MATARKKHPHPRLMPPKTVWKRWMDAGKAFKEKVGYIKGDEGRVIGTRLYSYHPTKGWRRIRAI